jgi:NAD+ kinase
MKIGIYGRAINDKDAEQIENLCKYLIAQNVELVVESVFFEALLDRFKDLANLKLFKKEHLQAQNIDMLFSIGGDGTLLDTVAIIKNLNIPVLGINAGRLGFLTGVNKENLFEALFHVINGSFTIDKRVLLQLDSNEQLFADAPYALNEFTIHKKDISSMIIIHAYLNGEFLTSYWADGLIVSTPTGSTAYNLSCGGPVLVPNSSNFVITPIAPHNLNLRPIVVPDDSVISFEIEGRSETFNCTLDSRMETIGNSVQLAIKKADFTTNLIKLNDTNFLQTLSQKLNWGKDNRN